MFSRTGDRKDLVLTEAENISGTQVKFLKVLQQGGKTGKQEGSEPTCAFRKRKILMLGAHVQMGGRPGLPWVVPLLYDRSNIPFPSCLQVCSKQLQ